MVDRWTVSMGSSAADVSSRLRAYTTMLPN